MSTFYFFNVNDICSMFKIPRSHLNLEFYKHCFIVFWHCALKDSADKSETGLTQTFSSDLLSLPEYLYSSGSVSCSVKSDCDPLECSPPGPSVHGIFQARILKWVVIPFSRRSSQSRDWTWVSYIAGRFFIFWATREAL